MQTYMSLIRFSREGHQQAVTGNNWLKDAEKTFEQNGANIKGAYVIMGRDYDAIFVCEFSTPESAMKATLKVNSTGSARIETIRVYSLDEVATLLG